MSDAESHDYLVAQLRRQLTQYEQESSRMSLREQAKLLADVQETVRRLGVAIAVRAGFSGNSGRERVHSYMLHSPNQVVDGRELVVISGVADYGRRIREMREAGYKILTGPDARDPRTGQVLRPDQYILLVSEDDSSPKPFR